MPISEVTEPHFLVACDECGERTGSEDYGGWVLYASREEAKRSAVEDYEWRVVDGRVTCEACLEEEKLASEVSA